MPYITAIRQERSEPACPPHWVHYKLDTLLTAAPLALDDPPVYFRDLVVSHQTGFLGSPETVLLPAEDAGQPLPLSTLRRVQDQHTEPAEPVRHYLTRYATPGLQKLEASRDGPPRMSGLPRPATG